MKVARRILFYLVILVITVVLGFTSVVFLFKDQIIREFIKEANKGLNTPVKIGKIHVSAWDDFPNLAIEFSDVFVQDSHPGVYPLFEARKVSFFLNPIEVWNGKYIIQGLKVTDSETNLKINAAGVNNFNILKDETKAGSNVSFNLKNIILTNTKVNYNDIKLLQKHKLESDLLTASVNLKDQQTHIEISGDLETIQIGIDDNVFLNNKKFITQLSLDYSQTKKAIAVSSSSLTLGHSAFNIKGTYSFLDKNIIDLEVTGKDTDVQSLISLLPDKISRSLQRYQSKGALYFNLALKGEISASKDPFLSIRFGFQRATFFHPELKSKIEDANLEGSFASPSMTSLSKAVLVLKNFTGKLNGQVFESNLSIANLDDPNVMARFKGTLDAASLLNFFAIDQLESLSGEIIADISLEGRIALLKKKETAQQVRANGTLELRSISLTLNEQKIHFKNINGSLQFNRNDLALSNVSGNIENSDFVLNGFFKNVIAFLLFKDQPIGIETDLKSNFIDLDELVAIALNKDASSGGFRISPQLHLNFNCDVRKMKYQRFSPTGIKGDLLIKNQMAVTRNITLHALGGDLTLNGIIDAKNSKAIDIVTSFKVNKIAIDSLFYVFYNFNQNFIEDKHLKGQAIADVSLEMILNEKLKMFPESLITDISITIKNGELNDFELLQKLNRFIDDQSLSRLRFADLKNDIHIEKRTIYIPQMEIRSNATNIQMSGTHTFDQHIDYRIVLPLNNKKKIDPDEAFGAIEEDRQGHTRLFLKIMGTSDKYEVSLDKQAVKKKIVNDLKKEVQELKDAFKLKGKKKQKELELKTDEYFDWDH